jgi:hypothetical protein
MGCRLQIGFLMYPKWLATCVPDRRFFYNMLKFQYFLSFQALQSMHPFRAYQLTGVNVGLTHTDRFISTRRTPA